MAVGERPRLTFVDALRGFALFGVFGANLMVFSGIEYMNDEQKASLLVTVLDRAVYAAQEFFVENKFMGLFSILFGISFWLFLDRARARGGGATPLFYRRIGWLFLFGAVHAWLLWCFDILRFYALWGVLLPLFVRIPLRRLLTIALGASLVVPALITGARTLLGATPGRGAAFDALALEAFAHGSFGDALRANWQYDWFLTLSLGQLAYQVAIFGRLLLGLWAARRFAAGGLAFEPRTLAGVVLIGAAFGVAGSGIAAIPLFAEPQSFGAGFARRLFVEAGFLGLTVAYAAGLALLFARPVWRWAVETLAPIGRMALSWYLAQTLFGIWLFYGFAPGPRLMGDVGPALLVVIWIVGFALQVVLARAWLRRFRFGPAEWLWRTLTYWRVQPLKLAVQD